MVVPGITGAASLKPGDIAPTWPPMADMAGEIRDLEDHIGKDVVLLDFWSIYCVSCVQEMPSLVALYDKYKDQGLMIYGIDLDSFSPKRVERFINGLNFTITYPVIIDRKRVIASAFKVGMLPTTIIIGKDGKVKLFHIGYKPGDEDEFDHLIQSLLN
jgi:thiol-disulfide isomerase/thioredoxin